MFGGLRFSSCLLSTSVPTCRVLYLMHSHRYAVLSRPGTVLHHTRQLELGVSNYHVSVLRRFDTLQVHWLPPRQPSPLSISISLYLSLSLFLFLFALVWHVTQFFFFLLVCCLWVLSTACCCYLLLLHRCSQCLCLQ